MSEGKVFIGIDIGAQGAFAALDLHGRLLNVDDLPYVGRSLSASRLRDQLFGVDVVRVAVETPINNPKIQKAQTIARSNDNFGRICATLELMGLSSDFVAPAAWKKRMQVPGGDAGKVVAVERAMQLWPVRKDDFTTARGRLLDGRAEAALIALDLLQRNGGVRQQPDAPAGITPDW